jgi:hypothetical protein
MTMTALTVDVFNDEGSILVRHVFYGEDEAEAKQAMMDHRAVDSSMLAAEKAGNVVGEFSEEIEDDEVPDLMDYE